VLILARHGRTAANAQHLLLGRMDAPLDELGVAQAAAIGVAMAARDGAAPLRIVASPLLRTRATAEAIAAGYGGSVKLDFDDRWLEVDYGEYDGVALTDVPNEVWQHWRTDPTWTPPGGESLADVGVRVRDACAELSTEAADQDVIVVTHVSPIKAAIAWAVGVDDRSQFRMFCDVASISRIRTTNGSPTLVSFNETAHLSGLARE
jgi:broad specificity phosphatase PhoE